MGSGEGRQAGGQDRPASPDPLPPALVSRVQKGGPLLVKVAGCSLLLISALCRRGEGAVPHQCSSSQPGTLPPSCDMPQSAPCWRYPPLPEHPHLPGSAAYGRSRFSYGSISGWAACVASTPCSRHTYCQDRRMRPRSLRSRASRPPSASSTCSTQVGADPCAAAQQYPMLASVPSSQCNSALQAASWQVDAEEQVRPPSRQA